MKVEITAYRLWDGVRDAGGPIMSAPTVKAAKIRARKRLNKAPSFWHRALVGKLTDKFEFVTMWELNRDSQLVGWYAK